MDMEKETIDPLTDRGDLKRWFSTVSKKLGGDEEVSGLGRLSEGLVVAIQVNFIGFTATEFETVVPALPLVNTLQLSLN